MDKQLTWESVVTLLIKSFPTSRLSDEITGRVKPLAHTDCVEMRRELPSLIAKDALYELPAVLYDLGHHDRKHYDEFPEFVIYYLDVIGTDSNIVNAELCSGIERMLVAADIPESLAAGLAKLLERERATSSQLSQSTTIANHASEILSRESSFSLFDKAQSYAVFRWLLIAKEWEEFDSCSLQRDCQRAALYWRWRCSGMRQGDNRQV